MISHLGPQLGIADGIALAHKLNQAQKATLVFTGDGGASEGDFHEAVNVAAVWQLPVIIGIENNAWGLSTPSNEQFRFEHFTDKAIGYGIPAEDAIQVDGNDVLAVYHAVKDAADSIRHRPPSSSNSKRSACAATRRPRHQVLPGRADRPLGTNRPCGTVYGLGLGQRCVQR